MTSTEINEIRERRLEACIGMVKEAYRVDGNGVAELIGVDRETWLLYERSPWGEKGAELLLGLSQLTGVRPSWLMCEDLEV